VLDEPTNHLDINARETLEETLKSYPGSMLFVSHDRQFIDALADKLWIVQEGQLVEHLGNYSDYTARLAARRASEQAPTSSKQQAASGNGKAPASSDKPSQEERQRRKRLAALEAEVETLEQELAHIKASLEQASKAQDIARITALGQQYTELESRLERCYTDWEQLAA
jgi:ATP-binding cassette subfamily F protein 3